MFVMFAGFFMVLGLIGLAAMIWVIYDVLVNQTRMPDVEKIIWILVALLLGLIGAIIYYVIVKAPRKYEKPKDKNEEGEIRVY